MSDYNPITQNDKGSFLVAKLKAKLKRAEDMAVKLHAKQHRFRIALEFYVDTMRGDVAREALSETPPKNN